MSNFIHQLKLVSDGASAEADERVVLFDEVRMFHHHGEQLGQLLYNEYALHCRTIVPIVPHPGRDGSN